jgi:putative DNA primase/helicase
MSTVATPATAADDPRNFAAIILEGSEYFPNVEPHQWIHDHCDSYEERLPDGRVAIWLRKTEPIGPVGMLQSPRRGISLLKNGPNKSIGIPLNDKAIAKRPDFLHQLTLWLDAEEELDRQLEAEAVLEADAEQASLPTQRAAIPTQPAATPPQQPLKPWEQGTPPPQQQQQRFSAVTVSAADVQIKPHHWLWKHWLARSQVALLCGPAAVNKSTMSLDFAAIVSRGGTWPDGSKCEPGLVFIFAKEDGVADTIVPRLQAMGASLKNIRIILGKRDCLQQQMTYFNVSTDLPLLKEEAAQYGAPSLVIIDPVYSVVGKGKQINAMGDVTESLDGLIAFASEFDCSVLGLMHFNKNLGARTILERVIHSTAFVTVPRTILAATKSQSDSKQRLLVRAKSSIGPDGDGFLYYIVPKNVAPDIEAITIDWALKVTGTPDELFAKFEGIDTHKSERKAETDSLGEASAFLYEMFAVNDKRDLEAARLIADAHKRGINERTLHRAKDVMGIVAFKPTLTSGWWWRYSTLIFDRNIEINNGGN